MRCFGLKHYIGLFESLENRKWRLQASKRIESDTNVRTSKHEEICEWKGLVELVVI